MKNFFRGAFLGANFLTSYSPTIPEYSEYDKITFYGGDADKCGYILDKVWGTNDEVTKKMIDNNSTKNWRPKWTMETYMLAEFQNNYSAGNVLNIEYPIENWLIYRAEKGSNILKFIDKIDVSKKEYVDFTALKNTTYKYYIFAQNATEISAPLITDYVDCYYHGWFLIDEENEIAYMFDLNLSGGDLSQIEDMSEYDTNLRYQAFSKGEMRYIEGNITAYLTDGFDTVQQGVDILEKFREFIANGKLKLLKDNKGRIFRVFTSNYSDNAMELGIKDEPRFVSFDFKEAGDVDAKDEYTYGSSFW